MARSDESDPYIGLNGADPYLAQNTREEPARTDEDSPLADKSQRKKASAKAPEPKKKVESAFEPSVLRSVVSAMQSIVKKLDDISTRPVKPPVVNVEAPKVTVEAPEVNITQKTPKRLRFRVTDRDEFGRIKDITVTVLE